MDRGERRSHEQGDGMTFKQTYRPFFLEYALLAEFNLVRRQQPVGVFVIPSSASALIWFGIIFVRQGHFEGGSFKFTIYIPDTFPDCDCPTVIFETAPFHPMVSSTTGEFDTSKSFPKWKKGTNHLWQLLLCLRRSFYQFDMKEPLFNVEAANLFEKDPNLFKHKATECVKLSNKRLLDAPSSCDPHALAFRSIADDEFDKIRSQMTTTSELTGGNSRRVSSTSSSASKAQGLSWVRPGTRTVFSKESSLLRIDDHDIDDADNDNKDDNNDDENDQVAVARSELDSASDEENFVGRS